MKTLKKISILLLFLSSLFSFCTFADDNCVSGKFATKGANNGYSRIVKEIEQARNRESNSVTLLDKCVSGLRKIDFSIQFPSISIALDQIIEQVCKVAVDAANKVILNDIASDISDYESYLNSISNQISNSTNPSNIKDTIEDSLY
jgi:hypothetical protein